MNEQYLALIDAAKTNPGIFKTSYTYSHEESENINQLVNKILEDNFQTTKDRGEALESLISNIFQIHKVYEAPFV